MTRPATSVTSVTCTAFQEVTWLSGSVNLFADAVAVFRIALSDATAWMPRLRHLLAPDERERAARYRRPDDGLRFSGTRALLRLLLARYTQQPPERVEFGTGVNQKPSLKQPGGWFFNVSHSAGWILIAIGTNRLGVDLEWINPDFAFRDVMSLSFSPDEQRYVAGSADARLAFYTLWTRKEALVKATAKGMDDTFGEVPSLMGRHVTDGRVIGQNGHWTVISFPVAGGYPAAVAHDGDLLLMPQFYTLDAELLILFD